MICIWVGLELKSTAAGRMSVCVCVCERERVCVCVRESVCVCERERECVCVLELKQRCHLCQSKLTWRLHRTGHQSLYKHTTHTETHANERDTHTHCCLFKARWRFIMTHQSRIYRHIKVLHESPASPHTHTYTHSLSLSHTLLHISRLHTEPHSSRLQWKPPSHTHTHTHFSCRFPSACCTRCNNWEKHDEKLPVCEQMISTNIRHTPEPEITQHWIWVAWSGLLKCIL